MGFEMLHRGEIDEDQLRALLKALDIAPNWREPLMNISYAPFTRVDIRRMNAVGVLDEKEVFKAYQDIGYNTDKAQKLTEFTLALNEPEKTIAEQEAEGLTRSTILNFFKDGTLDRFDTKEMLLTMDMSEKAAELFIVDAELDVMRRTRKRVINLILDKYSNGTFNKDETEVALLAANLEQLELIEAQTEMESIQEKRRKIPGKGDMLKFYKAGITDDEQFIDGMALNGYSRAWSELYIKLAQAGNDEDTRQIDNT
jgi:hypothetical protein